MPRGVRPALPPVAVEGLSSTDAKLAIAAAMIEHLRHVYCRSICVCQAPDFGHIPPCMFRLMLQQWDEVT